MFFFTYMDNDNNISHRLFRPRHVRSKKNIYFFPTKRNKCYKQVMNFLYSNRSYNEAKKKKNYQCTHKLFENIYIYIYQIIKINR